MPRSRPCRAFSALTLTGLLLGSGHPAAAEERRLLKETDLFAFQWVADPQISPDGRRIAFVRVTVDAKKEGYDSSLWIVATDGSEEPRPFTSGKRDLAPRWSSDGSRLVFTRTIEKDGKPQPSQLYLISSAGGEGRTLTDLPKGAGAPAWSPDGRTIAFVSSTNAKDLDKQKAKKDVAGEGDAERESDVRVITRAIYRFNGVGYLDPTRPSHVWTVEVGDATAPLPSPKQVTTGDYSEGAPVWSRDGTRLYFVSSRKKEPYYEPFDSDLYSVPATGGDVAVVASIDGGIADFASSPDGGRIAFEGSPHGRPIRSYNQPDLFVAELSGGAPPRILTSGYDFDIGGGLTGDQRAPRGAHPSGPVWSAEGKSLVIATAERGRTNLKRFEVSTGRVTELTRGDQEVMSYTATPDGSRLALVISTPTTIGDLYTLDAASGHVLRLTDFNGPLFMGIALTAPEEVTYTTFDGKRIQAWVQKPPAFDPQKKYPLILNIHGGPHAAYGYTFDHEFQWMAAKGYVVLYPNPRGSSAYGQEFGNVIQYRYPGDDYRDLMAGVDELIRRGYVDEKRLGVTGGSGGGVLTNWVVTQTVRFAAAVSQRSIADWAGFWYSADFTLFEPTWFRGAPWQAPADFAARSPITHMAKVTTPLMLIEGEGDDRTPPSEGGEQMFRALKFLKKPTVMVRFPGETHELSRSGKPWHRVERLQHIVGWFDRYLMDAKTDTYDVP